MGFLILSYDQTSQQRLHLHIYFFNFNLFVVKYFFIKSMVYIIKHSCKCWFYFIIFTAEYTCLSVCSVLLCMYLLFCCLCSKHLLHNKFSNPGRIRPLSNSIRTKFQTLNVTQGHKRSYQNPASNPVLKMPHRDTSLAIQQAIQRSQMMGTIHTCSLILGAATTFVVNTLLHKLLSNPYLSRYN